MTEMDDLFRLKLDQRDTNDAREYFRTAAADTPPEQTPAPAPAAPEPAPAPAAPAAPAIPKGATLRRTGPFPGAPEGYEYYTDETGGGGPVPQPAPAAPTAPAAGAQPAPGATGVAAGQPSLVAKPQEPQSSSFADALKAAAKDIGWGAVEAIPQFMIGGRVDALKHGFGMVQDFADYLEKAAPWLANPEAGKDQKEMFKAITEQYGKSYTQSVMDSLIDQPTTTTGKVFRSLGEFTTGFSPALTLLKQAGAATGVASVIAGAVAGFVTSAPDEEGLGNLLKKLPGGVGDALAPLATNPDDPAILNRARHALEQAGAGVLAEGVIKAVKAFHGWKMAAAAAKQQTPEAVAAAASEANKASTLVKSAAPAVDAQAPLFTMIEQPSKEALAANKLQEVKVAVEPGVPGNVLAEAISRTASMPTLKLNYELMTKDNLPDMAQQIGRSMLERLSKAKRGEMPLKVTQELAAKLGLTPEDLLAKPLGEAWNNEKIYGAAALLGQAEMDLRALAEVARVEGSSLAQGFALRRQLTYYAAMLENFTGVAGEAGRSLQIFKQIHKLGLLRQAKAMSTVIEMAGGIENTRALADIIANTDNFSMSMAVKKGWLATTSEALRTVEVMSMLMRPATQIRNIVGNTIMMATAAADIKFARFVGYMFGTPAEEAITRAGANAYIDAHFYALKDAFSAAGRTLVTGESQFGRRVMGGGRTAASGEGAIARNAESMSASQQFGAQRGWSDMQIKQFTESGLGKAIDYIGTAVTMPARFLTSVDDFYKTMMYSAKARQMATDEAVRKGLTGREFENFVAEKTLDPPANVHLDAADWAMWGTFNNKPGQFTEGAMKIRDGFGPLGYLVFPFLRTPGNIMSMTIQHSPLALVTRNFRNDVMAGGVVRDMALAKVAVGSGMIATAIAWAESGLLIPTERLDPQVEKLMGAHITGALPNNPALRDAYLALGMQKYALRVGDKWYSISGLGPVAPMLAYAAALAEIKRAKDVRPDMNSRLMENIGLAISAVYGSMENQSYFQGFAQVTHAMDEGARGHEGAMENYLNQLLGSATVNAVPFIGGAIQATQKLWEPDAPYKQTFSYWDAVKAHLYGLSESVGPVRDGLGRIVPAASWAGEGLGGRLYDWFSPFRITEFFNSPIDKELVRLQNGIQRIPKVDSFDGVKVDFKNYPEVFDMYQRLAGNELKDRATGLGLTDYLNAVITGDDPRLSSQHAYYETLMDSQGESAPGTKMAYIDSQVKRFKELAQSQVMAEAPDKWPAFYDAVTKEKQRIGTYKTGRAGIIAPRENWENKIMPQAPIETQYTRQPKPKPNGSGGAGFTVPTTGQ